MIKNVDEACADIKTKEEKVNLLVMCQDTMVGRTGKSFKVLTIANIMNDGRRDTVYCWTRKLARTRLTLSKTTETPEHLHLLTALSYYSRLHFIQHLLPLLQAATDLRRIVSVFAGTKEGHLDPL